MVGMIHVENHPTLLYISLYIQAVGLMVIEKKIFKKKSHHKSMQAIYPQGPDKFAPKRLDRQDLWRVPQEIAIHTKGPHGFRAFFH